MLQPKNHRWSRTPTSRREDHTRNLVMHLPPLGVSRGRSSLSSYLDSPSHPSSCHLQVRVEIEAGGKSFRQPIAGGKVNFVVFHVILLIVLSAAQCASTTFSGVFFSMLNCDQSVILSIILPFFIVSFLGAEQAQLPGWDRTYLFILFVYIYIYVFLLFVFI